MHMQRGIPRGSILGEFVSSDVFDPIWRVLGGRDNFRLILDSKGFEARNHLLGTRSVSSVSNG